jgi:hypothetical protein
MAHGNAIGLDAPKTLFLIELAKHGIVKLACEVSGLARSTAYKLKETDTEFADGWQNALEDAADALEAEAHRRSVEGIEKLVFQKGKAVIDPRTGEVYAERGYSDQLLLLRLKALKPDKYKDRVSQEVEHKGGVLIVPGMATDEAEWERVTAEQQAKYRGNSGEVPGDGK